MFGIMIYGVLMLVECGLFWGEVGIVLLVLWVGMMLLQLLMGWFFDCVVMFWVVLFFVLVVVFGMVWFLVGDILSGLWLVVFLVGLGGGGESGIIKYLLMCYFGLCSFGVIYGLIQLFIFVLLISFGVYLLGWLYDCVEGYGMVEWVLFVVFFLVVCSLFVFCFYLQKLF